MCQIILNVKGVLPFNHFQNSCENSPDSFGFAYVDAKGRLQIKKYVPKTRNIDPYVKKAYEDYTKARQMTNKPILIHTRISTAGNIDEVNCHPFKVGSKMAMAHNGVINTLSFPNTDHSDTWHLNEILKRFYKAEPLFLDNQSVSTMLSSFIGSSKLAFINTDGNYWIVNPKMGTYDADGNWFSNNSHCSVNNYSWYGNSKVYKTTTPAKHSSLRPFSDPYDMDDYDTGVGDIHDMKAAVKAYEALGSISSMPVEDAAALTQRFIYAYVTTHYMALQGETGLVVFIATKKSKYLYVFESKTNCAFLTSIPATPSLMSYNNSAYVVVPESSLNAGLSCETCFLDDSNEVMFLDADKEDIINMALNTKKQNVVIH
jgi:predicted glutamine amidotransferase